MTLIATAVPADRRSTALAVRLMGNRVGQVGFPLVAGVVAGSVGATGAIWMTCCVPVLSGVEKLVRGASTGAAAQR